MHILLIDDHPVFTQGLCFLLSELDSTARCAIADSLDLALQMSGSFDLLLLDFHMPGSHGFFALQQMQTAFADVPIIILSSDEDPVLIRETIVHGAAGFIPKSSTPQVLIAALRLILSGGTYLPPVALGLSSHSSPAPLGVLLEKGGRSTAVPMPSKVNSPKKLPEFSLSPRQRDVLNKLIQGKANKIIARELGLSEGTVKTHIASVFRVLGVNSRAEAICKVAQLGWNSNAEYAPAG